MSNLEAKISLQMNRFHYIRSVALECQEVAFATLQLQVLKVKLDLLNTNWEKFETSHERLADSKVETLLDNNYFKNGIFDQCLQYYATAKAELLIQIDERDKSNPMSGSQLANLTSGTQSTARCHLPEISLPNFSGDFSAWRPFHDLFSSLVGRSTDLSNVEKMHYLRTSLTGEAAQLISNLPLADDSFASAWDLLVARFENKRLLISAQVDRLFRINTISQRSAKDLNSLLNTTSEALNALNALGAPTHHWDHLLVHLITQRLDSITREAWEVKLGSSTEPPSYQALRTFLTGRARALESIEIGAADLPSTSASSTTRKATITPNAARVHVSTASTLTSSEPSGCSLCAEPHYIVTCPRFRDMSATARRNHVIEKRLCFNCLGRHNASACQNEKRCRECGNKHHTMIHQQLPLRLTSTPRQATTSSLNTSTTQTSAPPSPSDGSADSSE